MTERDILISAIITLWASLLGAAAYVKHLHEKHAKDQKETTKTVTEETVKSRQAIENNTKVLDKLFDQFQKAKRG